MKKTMTFLVLMTLFSAAGAFAQAQAAAPQERTPDEKVLGASLGARLSILGVVPEASFLFKNLEVGVFAPMVSGEDYDTKESQFGAGIGTFVGYVDKPFRRGWQNGIGLKYLYLPETYTRTTLFGGLLDDVFDSNFEVHVLSFYYRGTIKFNEVVGMNFNLSLPLYIGNSEASTSVIDTHTAWINWLMIPCTFGIGLRFEI